MALLTELHNSNLEPARIKELSSHLFKPATELQPGDLGRKSPITFVQEATAVLFLLLIPGSMFWFPILTFTFLVLRMYYSFLFLFVGGILLSLLPVEYSPNFVHGKLNRILFRYFSFKCVYQTELDPNKNYLLIAPPHGVFPYGNILTVHGMHSLFGFDFRGLTTTVALLVPTLRHYFGWIGLISATKSTVLSFLRKGWSIGISSGGVAEIFETGKDDEVILMKERKGFVKLALQTGTPLVPCYLFGNTQLFHIWYDQGGFLQALSRRVGFGCCLMWGRWGLPIMFRVPIVGVVAEPIAVPQVENPSQQQIDDYHSIFVQRLRTLFEEQKANYGWSNKRLVIK